MISPEKDLRDSILKNMDAILPSVSVFISLLLFPGNEWAAAASSLLLVLPYALEGWRGMRIIWWAIALMLLAGILDRNYIALVSYWLLVSGLISLMHSHLRQGRPTRRTHGRK